MTISSSLLTTIFKYSDNLFKSMKHGLKHKPINFMYNDFDRLKADCLKCTKCGQVYHLSEETSKIIVQNVLENDSFSLENDTVLSGKCANCK